VTALAATSARAETLINGIDAAFPPFAFIDTDGKAKGFDVEAVDWIANKMGFAVTHRAVAWEGIIPSLMAKKIDFICSGMGITEKRAQQVNFTNPYWAIQNVFVVKTGSALTADQILTGKKTIGLQQGTAEEQWLAEARKSHKDWNYTTRQYSAAQMAIGDVVNGRIDAAGMNDAPAKDAIKNGLPIQVAGQLGYAESYGCAVRKGNPEILKKLNEGYRLLQADPKWEELKAKYKP
ncbi:MAG: amino acid ABC transporter substrate-binding protein, partial [Rhodospirillaceae bacterium]|nr:amino acid ABC transporter substrate-binding protein [Rhodospirillaceae bacterium]